MAGVGVVNTLYHADLISFLETRIPGWLSESWDNCGLQAGSRKSILKGVLCCLDISEAVIDEAVAGGANFIFSHHPLLFKPLPRFDWDVFPGNLLRRALAAEITLYCAHTNLDSVSGGVNDYLAAMLKIGACSPLQAYSGSSLKLVTFVPQTAVETVAAALFAAGAGRLGVGNYSECSFRSSGTGTFRPGIGASPQVGEIGQLNFVDEIRLETVVAENSIASVIEALLQAHPYEVPAYDLYPLNFNEQSCGAGRVGVLEKAVDIDEFATFVKKQLKTDSVRLIGGYLKPEVKKIALCGGSGFSLYNAAQMAGADLFITGDLKYHDARSVLEQGKIPVLDAGHFATERPVAEVCADWCREFIESKNAVVEVAVAKSEREPWTVR
jgi:dinuclear metal center YbgI/SA1388 family protein